MRAKRKNHLLADHACEWNYYLAPVVCSLAKSPIAVAWCAWFDPEPGAEHTAREQIQQRRDPIPPPVKIRAAKTRRQWKRKSRIGEKYQAAPFGFLEADRGESGDDSRFSSPSPFLSGVLVITIRAPAIATGVSLNCFSFMNLVRSQPYLHNIFRKILCEICQVYHLVCVGLKSL